MNSPVSDAELGRKLREAAAAARYSPDALINLAIAAAERGRWSVMPNFYPFPRIVLSETLGEEHLDAWPDWSERLIQPGYEIQQLNWPDGTVTTRLLSPRGLVLAATIDRPGDPSSI